MLQFLSGLVSYTPLWVWILLFGLLTLGIRALSAHSTPRSSILVMPIVLALIGVFGAGRHGVGLVVWAISLVLAFLASTLWWKSRPAAAYHVHTDRIHFAGSAGPLLLMLTVFVCSYGLQVLFTLRPQLRQSIPWQTAPAIVFGMLTGALFSRRWQLFRLRSAYSIGRASFGSG